ncbi:MAG TPA: lantibiotic dehydratase C-terminal domain-containing protein [Candidatus Limnocylindrales bacterium]|nr:lantibiotic dehydratase C-terminal domain-containing protein [Candidatus Limnocylindrales bacterium]
MLELIRSPGTVHSGQRPLVADRYEAGLSRPRFFIRHWDGGPHVRLRALPTSPTVCGECGSACPATL